MKKNVYTNLCLSSVQGASLRVEIPFPKTPRSQEELRARRTCPRCGNADIKRCIAEETEEYFEGENDIHPAGNFILTFFECSVCDKVFMVRGQ